MVLLADQFEKRVNVIPFFGESTFTNLLSYRLIKFGTLDLIVLHELCHAIENKEIKENFLSGFDTIKGSPESLVPINLYNPDKRKYERLNETITDIFAIEAREEIYGNGNYIFEPQKQSLSYVRDFNTGWIVKNLLTKFLKEYRKEIIHARMTGDMQGLFDVIGKENFEELNDIVSKVDLQAYTLEMKILNNEKDSPIVLEYNKQLERLEEVYKNMEKYKIYGESSNYGHSSLSCRRKMDFDPL